MSELTQMGFPEEACKRAIFFTNNQGLNDASNWLMEHISDSDFSQPFILPGLESNSGLIVTLLFISFLIINFNIIIFFKHFCLMKKRQL